MLQVMSTGPGAVVGGRVVDVEVDVEVIVVVG